MKYDFEILKLPRGPEPYRLVTDIEGRLTVLADNEKLFFQETGILLVELAVALRKWMDALERGEIQDFYYSSMDFEEEPIISYEVREDGCRLGSVWAKIDLDTPIPLSQVIDASEDYVRRLKAAAKNLGLELSGYQGL